MSGALREVHEFFVALSTGPRAEYVTNPHPYEERRFSHTRLWGAVLIGANGSAPGRSMRKTFRPDDPALRSNADREA